MEKMLRVGKQVQIGKCARYFKVLKQARLWRWSEIDESNSLRTVKTIKTIEQARYE